MTITKNDLQIEQKGDMFLIHRSSTELVNAQQFLQIHNEFAKQKAELSGVNKKFDEFEKFQKIAQEVFMTALQQQKIKEEIEKKK